MEFMRSLRRCVMLVPIFVVALTFSACARIEELLPIDLPFLSSAQEEDLIYIPMYEIPLAEVPVFEAEPREPQVMVPELGEEYLVEGCVTVNVGNVSRGYFKVKHDTEAKALVKITNYGYGQPDFFNLEGNNDWEVFPLTRGDGVYTIQALEHYEDRVFVIVFSHDVSVSLDNQNYPFLYPSRYVSFNDDFGK